MGWLLTATLLSGFNVLYVDVQKQAGQTWWLWPSSAFSSSTKMEAPSKSQIPSTSPCRCRRTPITGWPPASPCGCISLRRVSLAPDPLSFSVSCDLTGMSAGLWVRNGTGYIQKDGSQFVWSVMVAQMGYWLAAFPSSSGREISGCFIFKSQKQICSRFHV